MKTTFKHIANLIKEENFAASAKSLAENLPNLPFAMVDMLGEKIKDSKEKIEDWETVGFNIVSNMTANTVENLLIASMHSIQKKVDVFTAGVTGFPFDLINPTSEVNQTNADVNILILDDEIIFTNVNEITNLDAVQKEINSFLNIFQTILNQQAGKTVLIGHTIPLSPRNYNSILDYQNKMNLMKMWREMNMKLIEIANENADFYLYDLDTLMNGVGDSYDEQYAFYSDMRYSFDVFNLIAKECTKIIAATKGLAKKCLVLDLDNTVWKGILGDDGIDGVKMGNSLEGKPFQALQALALRLKQQGVLLAICSKNDHDNVVKALNEHPEILLREEDFAAIYANWEPKSRNLMNIAKDLNINPNSLVFIDDSSFERAESRANSEVYVAEITEHPEMVPRFIENAGFFNKLVLTNEDQKRTEYFKASKERTAATNNKEVDYTDYLHSLKMELMINVDSHQNINRISQLEQRTNQFNLTTRRYTLNDITTFSESPDAKVYSFELVDRFGSYGCISSLLVQKSIQEVEGKSCKTWNIVSFLLSCRVFSRDVETEILRIVMNDAKEDGAEFLFGEFIESKKNINYKDLYVKNGFEAIESEKDCDVFRRSLSTELTAPIEWIESKVNIEQVKLEKAA